MSILENSSTKGIEFGINAGQGFVQAFDRTNSVVFPYYFAGTSISFVTGGASPVTNTRVTFDSAGNVGIGTTSPNALTNGLEIYRNGSTANLMLNRGSNANYAYSGYLPAGALSASNVHWGSGLFANSNNYEIWTYDGTSNVERFVIKNDGNVGIGTTGPTQKLQVGASGDGSVALANAWNTFSDIRLKRDLTKIQDALKKLEKLNGYYYFWKNGEDQSRQVGVVALEVEKVLPELVKTGEDGIKTVDYPKLTALLIEVAKEQARDAAQIKVDSAKKDADISKTQGRQ